MAEFHETVYGKRFFDGQLPRLIEALEAIGTSLEAGKSFMEKVATATPVPVGAPATPMDILEIIHECVASFETRGEPLRFKDISFDNDNKSGEIIFELLNGQSWTLSTSAFRVTGDE